MAPVSAVPIPLPPPVVVDTADKAAARREAANERSRRYRARRAELQGATPKQAERIAEAETRAATPGDSPAAAPRALTAAELRAVEERLLPAIAGAVELLADVVAETQLPKGAPSLGQQRAERIAALWAPLLAPNVARGGSAVPVLIAASATAAPLLAWRNEVRAWHQGGPRE